MSAIGVFDSGAGGLSIVAAIHAAMPAQPIAYFADTAFAPYGTRSDREILERTHACCARLLEQSVSALVIACNTATASAIDELRAWSPVPVVGVEPGLKPAAKATCTGVVGVLATRATLASRRYRELLERVRIESPGVRFAGQAGQGWVELVESGELDSTRAHTLVHNAVQPLLDEGADTLVLGCTHYPFLRHAISRVARSATIIETGPAIARELQRRLGDPGPVSHLDDGSGLIRFQTSGDDAQFAALATRLLSVVQDKPGARPRTR